MRGIRDIGSSTHDDREAGRRPVIERLARRCAGRPWLVLASWGLAIVVAAVLVILFMDDLSASDSFLNEPESERAADLIAEHMPGGTPNTEIVIIRSENLTVDDPAFKAVVQELQQEIAALGAGHVLLALTYYDVAASEDPEGGAALVSDDRRTTLLPVTLSGGSAARNVAPVYELVREASGRLAASGFRVAITGNATWEHEAHPLASSDLRRGETIGIPIALVVLVFVFGTLVAAAVPFALGLCLSSCAKADHGMTTSSVTKSS